MKSRSSTSPSEMSIIETPTSSNDSDCDSETKSGTSIILYGTSDSGSENKNRGWAMLSEMSNGEAASSITDFSSDSWTNG
ncbi:uncharacterized protein LOC143913613 isoform X2 [Arctopsyche grandis]|uniref:uncharacterized protein LOC143913613 isoform X2 n=1 Tax=Arctopsyche grandis TaxID=121162 RepID=UPI00406D8E25